MTFLNNWFAADARGTALTYASVVAVEEKSVIDYNKGMHVAAEDGRPFRWVIPVILVVSIETAVWDGLFGTWGNAVASAIYLVLFLIELFWWPKKQAQLLEQKHHGFSPEVFSANGQGPYLVVVGGALSHDAALKIRQKARGSGLPRDAYVQNFNH